MPLGSLELYSSRMLRGDLVYDYITPLTRLGGLSNPIHTSYKLEASTESGARLVEAYLEVAITSPEPYLRYWRLWLDGVAITREFKPLTSVRAGNHVFSKIVFNVTPILNPSKREHVVAISYEGGREIIIDHVGLLVIYEADECKEKSYAYLSGALLLDPGDYYTVPLSIPLPSSGELNIRVYGVMPARQARLTISVNGEALTSYGGYMGGVEVVAHRELKPTDKLVVELRHEKPAIQYYPRYIKVSSLLVEVGPRREPVIDVEASPEADGIRVSVRNNGTATAENVILLSVSKGMVLDRKFVGELRPGAAVVEKLKGVDASLVRVVWRYKGKTMFKDYRVK